MSDDDFLSVRPPAIELPIAGLLVGSIEVNARLTFHLYRDRSERVAQLSVSGACNLVRASSVVSLDSEASDLSSLGVVLNLFYSEVQSATARLSGELSIVFVGARCTRPGELWELTAASDVRYEAWELVGPGRIGVVCGPGAEGLSTWGIDA